jgi:hypothetical protein
MIKNDSINEKSKMDFKIRFKYYGGRKWGRDKKRITGLTQVGFPPVKCYNNSIFIARTN